MILTVDCDMVGREPASPADEHDNIAMSRWDAQYETAREQWQQHIATQLHDKLLAAGFDLERVPPNAEDPVRLLAVGVDTIAVVRRKK